MEKNPLWRNYKIRVKEDFGSLIKILQYISPSSRSDFQTKLIF